MRIAISALFQASGGSLTNVAQLLREWSVAGDLERHEFIIFASRGSERALRQGLPDGVLDRVRIHVLPLADAGLPGRVVAEQVLLPRLLRAEKADVVFCPANVIPYASRVPSIVTFQNAAPFCDSVTRRSVGLVPWLRFLLLGAFVRASAHHATRVIFISQFFRDLFITNYGFDAERGSVIVRGLPERRPTAPGAAALADVGIRGPFVLSVSHLNPYKNILELITGFVAARRDRGTTHQLVLAGGAYFAEYRERIGALLRDLKADDGTVLLPGSVPPPVVEQLLSGAESFLFSSTCENCPTALIEALAHGLPIGCSDVGVMPEVGGDAVLYFDPYDPASIANVAGRLMTEPELREDLSLRARARAATFKGERVIAQETLRAIEAAAGGGR